MRYFIGIFNYLFEVFVAIFVYYQHLQSFCVCIFHIMKHGNKQIKCVTC